MPDLGVAGAGESLVLNWLGWNPQVAIILMWNCCNSFHRLDMNLLDDEALFVTATEYKSIYK